MPIDGGFISKISEIEATEIRKDPIAFKYLKRIMGGDEMISDKKRYCLWMVDSLPEDLRNSSILKSRVLKVKETRLKSIDKGANRLAEKPHLFRDNKQPLSEYIGLPLISSERRDYIPVGMLSSDIVASANLQIIDTNERWLFSYLSSKVYNVWVKSVSGKMKMDPIISSSTGYNIFPFIELTSEQKASLEASGQAILDARAKYPTSTLADLYDPLAMPVELREAHKKNDKLVLALYGLKPENTYDEIINELFKRYKELTSSK